MNSTLRGLGMGLLALAASQAAHAGTAPYFHPLQQSAAVAPPNHVNELNSPWQTPGGISQVNLTSMSEIEADIEQSVQRVPAGRSSSMWDMLAYDPSGRYVFIPHETPFGAGLSRYDTETDTTELLFAGDQEASLTSLCDSQPLEAERDPTNPACPAWDFDFGAFDPARWTPNGTVILAEEWTALGRVVEILDPLGPAPIDPTATPASEDVSWRVLNSIAKVSHEGINFSLKHPNDVIYYIDEWRSGSIYKLVLKESGNYALGGQTFVLSVDDFLPSGGDPSANWNEGPNASATRFGPATWVPITDADGNRLPGTLWDPFQDGPTADPRTQPLTRGGRGAADEVGGTPFGRPEDMTIGLTPKGNEILYVTTTSEQAVISIEIESPPRYLKKGKSLVESGPEDETRALVRQFASRETPKNLGFLPTTGQLDSPDNLAIDALGNVYIIEDQPNRSDVGGDIWFARDMDSDGVAESLDHFMSIQVDGSESTGMIFHPTDPTRFVVAVQHPDSTDLSEVPDGFGDAMWEFSLAGVVPPTCEGPRSEWHTFDRKLRKMVRACTKARDFNFVDQLDSSGPVVPVNP
ncbi:MAG: alkaline phosphatase PhoX [bacterium]